MMETVLNREAFLRALESAKPGLAAREIVEQSLCFVLRDGKVITYNDEASVRGPSGLPKAFVGAVDAAPLLEALRRIEADDVRVSASEDTFSVGAGTAATGRTTIELALQADVRLPVDAVDAEGEYHPLHENFAEALGLVHQCASKDESKFVLTLVNATPDMIESCDNYQACRWKMVTGLSGQALLKRSSVSSAGQLGVTEVSEGESWVHFRNARGFVLSCRRFVEEYPSDRISPVMSSDGVRVVLPKQLKEAAELANVFSAQKADFNVVRVDVWKNRVRVTGQGLTGKAMRTLPANWPGDPIAFLIAPALLGELVTKYNEVQLSEEVLKVDAGNYVYATMLASPEPDPEPARKPRKKADVDQEAS